MSPAATRSSPSSFPMWCSCNVWYMMWRPGGYSNQLLPCCYWKCSGLYCPSHSCPYPGAWVSSLKNWMLIMLYIKSISREKFVGEKVNWYMKYKNPGTWDVVVCPGGALEWWVSPKRVPGSDSPSSFCFFWSVIVELFLSFCTHVSFQ